ncbi:MAG: alpha/beta hydrolase [Alphaproteobacteria bacterium]|nr:alpha/beta hydrolase [Alphaproteobacteria bacterium]MCD8570026.1 alpha/beta hydrolase [Alphaproteobacteria bacterium]
MQEIIVTTDDDLNLTGWLKYPRDDDKPVLIFFHGNAQTIEHRLGKVDAYINAGYGVMLPEYRGYGGNPGTPMEDGLYKDARAYLNFIRNDPRLNQQKLIIYGESLGSGVAVQMATEFPPYRLVLEVPFSSALDVAQSRFFFIPFLSYLMHDHYDNTSKIKNVECPVLVGTAGNDFVVPNRFGQKLYNAVESTKKLVHYESAMHHNMYDYGFAKEVIAFSEEAP